MKFKALAAAVALMSTATVAQAEWHDGFDEATAFGNGELLLVAFDDVRKVSVVQDLGGAYLEMWDNRSNGGFTKDFDLNPLFASVFATSNAADIQWSVYANNYGYADAEGYNEPARFSQGFMVTSNSANPTIDRSIGNDISHQNVLPILSGNTNGAMGFDGDYAINGAFAGNASNGLYAGTQAFYGTDLLGSVVFNTTALSTESAFFWALLTSQTSNGALAGSDNLIGSFSLDLAGDNLHYSAVPVPAAVWLLASGLLGLGAVSRRRKA